MRANVSTTILLAGLFGPLAGLPGQTPAAPTLETFQARYEVRRGSVTVGEIERRLRQSGQGYQFSSSTRTTGLAALLTRQRTEEHSDFLSADDGLRPLRYRYSRRKGDEHRQRSAEFDWAAGEVRFDFGGRQATLEITDALTDPLLYQLMLADDLARGRQDLHYRIADRGRLKDYRFVIVGQESVATPSGSYQTIAVRRDKDSGSEQNTFYLAPALDYLAVRVDLLEDDSLTQALLSEYRRCASADAQPCR